MWLQNVFATRFRSTSEHWDTPKIILWFYQAYNSKEKQRQFYSSVTQEEYYSFNPAICFTGPILFTNFSFRQSLYYRYLVSNIANFLLNVSSGSIKWSTVALAFLINLNTLLLLVYSVDVILWHGCYLFLSSMLSFIIDNDARL